MSAPARVAARRMRGLTLVELLVALTLGLLITVATIAGYLGLSEAARMAETQARMDEDAQAALSMVATHLRMAGSNPVRPNRSPSTRTNPVYPAPFAYPVRGCDGTFTNITTAGSIQELNCAEGPSASPDSIAITYEADRYNTVTPSPSFEPTDCLGYPLQALQATVTVVTPLDPGGTPTEINFHAAENRFYIANSAAGAPSLYCRGNGAGTATAPLVENVEDLQLTYGTVPAAAAATHSADVAGYLDASDVTSHPTLAPLPDGARWAKVASVRVCVVIRSTRPLSLGEGSAQYLKCDGSLETNPPDSHLRRAYSTTVVLRNRRH